MNAKGLAIITVCKLGFLVTARAGSGIVIAKTGDDGVSGKNDRRVLECYGQLWLFYIHVYIKIFQMLPSKLSDD